MIKAPILTFPHRKNQGAIGEGTQVHGSFGGKTAGCGGAQKKKFSFAGRWWMRFLATTIPMQVVTRTKYPKNWRVLRCLDGSLVVIPYI